MYLAGKSPERRFEQATKFRQEQRWFQSPYLRPAHVRPMSQCLDSLEVFQDLIWNFPTREILPEYGMSTKQVHVCV